MMSSHLVQNGLSKLVSAASLWLLLFFAGSARAETGSGISGNTVVDTRSIGVGVSGNVTVDTRSTGFGVSGNTTVDTLEVPVLTNLVAMLDENLGRYSVGYDVGGVGGTVTVSGYFSVNGGATWQAMQTMSGAVGSGQSTGTGRTLVWNYVADGLLENAGLGATVKLQVRASADGAASVGLAEVSYRAPASQPVVATLAALQVGTTGATLAGSVNRYGMAVGAQFDWGTSAGALTNHTAVQPVLSAGVISLSAGLTGLTPGATYFYRISAAKTGGAAQLGGVLSFTTTAVPVVGNLAATLDEEAARYTVRYDVAGAGSLTVTPQFSLDNGATWQAMQTTSGAVGSGQSAGTSKTLVWAYGADSLRENVALGATLRLRVRATDAASGVGSADIATAAPATQPMVATLAATLAGSTSGQLQGTVNRHGLGVVSWFEWGTALEALTNRTPTRSVSGLGAVGKEEWIENLKPGTIYYYRMAAVKPGSTAQRGTVKTFTTQEAADKLDAKLTVTASGKPSEVGPKPGFFKITRGGDVSQPMELTLRMRGKAINGVDYDEIPETLVLAAGAKSAVVTILPKQDSIVEGPETVVLLVVPTGSYRSSLKGATLSIREDDKLDGPTMSYPANDAGLPRTQFEKVDTVGEKTGVRWYRISGVPPGTRLNLTVTGPLDVKTGKYKVLLSNVTLTLFDETGSEEKRSANARNNPEFISKVLERGGDYLASVAYVAGFGASKTPFILTASGGENWALVENVSDEGGGLDPGEVHHVGLILSAQSPMSVPNAATWIVSHGRTDKPETFDGIAAALANAEPGAQVLSVDWRTAATVPTIGVDDYGNVENGRWFVKIGKALGKCLAETQSGAARFRGSELSYVGHSWGTYICYEIARNMQEQRALGNAPRFVALDPAIEALNYADSAVNFSAFSDYSMGFQSSNLGNEERVADCTDGFDIHTPAYYSANPLKLLEHEILRHNVAHYAFRSLLVNNDRISKLFRTLLFAGAPPVWAKNPGSFHKRANYKTDPVDYTFVGSVDPRFEGVLDAQGKGEKWIFTNFYYEVKP